MMICIFFTSIIKQSFVSLPEPPLQRSCHLKMTLMQFCLLVGTIPCVFTLKKVHSPKWGRKTKKQNKKPSYMVTWRVSSVTRRTDTEQTEMLVFAYHSLNTQITFMRLGENRCILPIFPKHRHWIDMTSLVNMNGTSSFTQLKVIKNNMVWYMYWGSLCAVAAFH